MENNENIWESIGDLSPELQKHFVSEFVKTVATPVESKTAKRLRAFSNWFAMTFTVFFYGMLTIASIWVILWFITSMREMVTK